MLVVTHSPQIAARADAHWRVSKHVHGHGEAGARGAGDSERVQTAVEPLAAIQREEEIARMLAGAEVTEAARAAARALMHA